jgi:hypothetical protein
MLRTAEMTVAPTRANSRAVTNPKPLLAPVTMTVRPENDGRSAAVQTERGLPSDPDPVVIATLLLGGEQTQNRMNCRLRVRVCVCSR